jgi:hypothetical protein
VELGHAAQQPKYPRASLAAQGLQEIGKACRLAVEIGKAEAFPSTVLRDPPQRLARAPAPDHVPPDRLVLHGNWPAVSGCYGVRGISVVPRNADVLLAAVGDQWPKEPVGVMLSRDGGETWKRVLPACFGGNRE